MPQTIAPPRSPLALPPPEQSFHKIADLAAPLIKRFEGLRLKAYQDSVGVWTIGYGHTADVAEGDVIDEATADRLLRRDLTWAIEAAERIADTAPEGLNTAQIAALTSWIFNVGATAALSSRAVTGRIRAGDLQGAANGLLLWNKAGGRVLNGLTRRREAERALFLSEGVSPAEPQDSERLTPDNPEKGIGSSTTIPATGTGAIGILVMIGEYVSNATGLAPEQQKWVLLTGAMLGFGGLVWAGWERWRKHRTAEGW